MVRADNYPNLKASNGNWAIDIYQTESGMWTFQGNDRSEAENSLISGIDDMLEYVKFTHGDFKNFQIQFGSKNIPVDNAVEMFTFELVLDEHTDKYNKRGSGNTYYCVELDSYGWLCSVLFDFFEIAPNTFYMYIVEK